MPPKARIRCEIGAELTFPYDAHRRDELTVLAVALEDAGYPA